MNLFYAITGWLCVVLGCIGIVVPVLPTTPFLLLASYLFLKGSPKARKWLHTNRYLGAYIKDFEIDKSIPLRVKITSITLLWTTILLSAFLAVKTWWLQILLIIIAIAVTLHILSFKTKK